MSKIKKDQVLGIIGLVLSAFIIWQTSMLKATAFIGDPGPKMFPYLASALLAVCSIVLIIKPDKKAKTFLKKDEWIRAVSLFGVYVANLILMHFFGFNVAVPVTLFVITFTFSKMSSKGTGLRARLIKSFLYAAIGFAVLYLFYDVALEAQLPKGILFK